MKIGYDIQTQEPIEIDMMKTGMVCCVGSTGSGKTSFSLYLLYNLLKTYKVKLYICDFKKSGDFSGITGNFAEFDEVTQQIEDFYAEFINTPEGNEEIKVLLIDEYAGYIIWLMQQDKKKADEIKNCISSLLMMGRSRRCFVWCIQQRISASLFPTGVGAIDNFQICIGLGRLSVESRKSLFAGEHLEDSYFEETYHPKQGQGFALIDNQGLMSMQVPYISDIDRLKKLLQEMGEKG